MRIGRLLSNAAAFCSLYIVASYITGASCAAIGEVIDATLTAEPVPVPTSEPLRCANGKVIPVNIHLICN
ncbi:hypothetical protein CC2G_014150 [Coprinopsis cinerea AmutBmut pab1-1]|nr:hypothetical protein CC2G_014150 [Coprinopsis cinerea AmutBmut pab1-1]